jgi:hypothetical protein
MSTVAPAGDWHGNTQWAIALILHLGDFGIWPRTPGRI